MKKYLFSFLFLSFNFLAHAQDFITHWDLSLPGSGATQLTFGVGTSGTCSYTWETIPAGTTGSGTFSGNTISITGLPSNAMIRLMIDTTNFRRINIDNGIDRKRLKDVEQWGGVHWNSMATAFRGCENLNITSIDIPNLSSVTSMSNMFGNCYILNGPINIDFWNTSNITNMSNLFYGSSFNQPIGNWNTSNVTDMGFMFSNATSFNQPIGNWNTSNVTNMSAMFYVATFFNQPIDNWNTSNVTNMAYMFCGAALFNQPIGNWNTSNVTNMSKMFASTDSFNQPIGNWNTSNATDMNGMFWYAYAFNQPIDNWYTSNVTNMYLMFKNATSFNQSIGNWHLNQNDTILQMLNYCGMDCMNYSATISGWSNNPITPYNRVLEASNLKYFLSAQNDRNYLISAKGWTITGDLLANNNCCATKFDTINISACISFFFNGQTITSSGTYYDTLMNVNGCDSLITLFLTINQNSFTLNDSACNSYFFNGQTITNSGTYYDTLMNVNGCDSLITLNLTIYQSNGDSINQTACNSYFFNGQTITNSGTYYDTLMNANGCDSLITLNLTINQTDTSLLQTGALLTANATGATYQWLTCNPFQEIIGETNQNFIAAANGDYAVIVTQNGCTDTSACYTVNNVGINNFDLSNNIKIFPNPVSQNLQIESATAFQNANIKILNITGLVIAEYLDISTKTFSIDMSSYSSDSYLIQITSPSYKYIKRIYKGQ